MAKKKKKKKKDELSHSGVGKWGDFNFSVSQDKSYTFYDMKWTTTFNWEAKGKGKKTQKIKLKGIAPDEFSFSMRLSVFTGINPKSEIDKLDKKARKKKKYRLIIGGQKYGKYKVVIAAIERELKFFDNKGNLWVAVLNVTMKECR